MDGSPKFSFTRASVIGLNHKSKGLPCQDSCDIKANDDWIIAAVADGHGSSQCKYSDTGAKQAVETFISTIADLYAEINDPIKFHSFLSRNRSDQIPMKICQQWEREISEIHKTENFPEDFDPILYGSTLIGLVIFPNFYFAFQLGDGDILSVEVDGITNRVIEIEKILGTETYSLSSKNAWKNVKTEIRFFPEEDQFPRLFSLSTDGLSNSFISDSGFLSSGNDYLSIIKEHGFSAISENLPNWLEEISNNGSGDDISMALITRMQG